MTRFKSVAVWASIAILIAAVPGIAMQVAGAGSDQDSMLVVVLSGSPEERGFEYGRLASDQIKGNLALFWEDVDGSDLSPSSLLTKAEARENVLPDDMRDEIRGMASGAGVNYIDLLAMNLYGGDVGGMGGCTQFVAAGSGTVDGNVVASKNRDESGVNILMIMESTDESYGFIAVTEAGYWGVSFGLNEMSLCDGNNWMPIPSDAFWEGGYTELTSNRIVLERCGTVDEAIQLMDDLPKYGGSTLMVADRQEAAFIETVPSDGNGYWKNPEIPDIVAKKVTDNVSCHTNHYIYEPYYSMVINESFGTMWTPSIARYDNGLRLMAEADYVVSAELVISFCRDLEDFGNSHPNWIKDQHPEIPWECWEDGWPGFSICNARTVSSGVFEMSAEHPEMLSRMWTAIYNPCWCPYVPLHNGLVSEADLAGELLMPYRDGTAWLVSMRLRSVNENDWGCMVPTFEEWEEEARTEAESDEAYAIGLIDAGNAGEAAAYLTDNDCARALEAIVLMLDLGSWVNGEYDETSSGEGLRSGEVGEKQA